MWYKKRLRGPTAAAAAVVALGIALPSTEALASPPPTPAILGAGTASAVPDSYIVVLKDTSTLRAQGVAARAQVLGAGHHGKVGHVWTSALHGFAMTMSEADAKLVAAEPEVAYVQQQHAYKVTDSQVAPPSWGVDRVDQRSLPLDGSFNYDKAAGAGVHAYIIDTGIRITNPQFGGRASYGIDTSDSTSVADDCQGHGTHVAGTVGSNSYGMAKKVQLVAVRVFDCDGRASSDTPILDGIDWVTSHAIRPAVINLSLGSVCTDAAGHPAACPGGTSQGIVDAEKRAIAAGIPVVTAAGNDNLDACGNPVGSAGGTINVGAIGADGAKASFSNFGFCVDIWAPGVNIVSVGGVHHDGAGNLDPDPKLDSGTSMAAPHVTGAVAILMSTPQFATATPAQIADYLDKHATTGVITGLDNASPNKLLYSRPTTGPSIALARTGSGSLNMFGVNAAGIASLRPQTGTTATALTWGALQQSARAGWNSVAAEADTGGADARIETVGLAAADDVWRRRQASANATLWTNWSSLDGLLRTVALARNQNNNLEAIGANKEGGLFFRMQTDPATDTWAPWQQFTGTGWMVSVTADTGPNGLIDVFATDSHGKVWHSEQTTANSNNWSAFTQLPDTTNKAVDEITVTTNRDNTLDLIGTDMGGGVWHRKQTGPNSATWSAWTRISTTPNTLLHVAAEANADGRIEVVGVDNTGSVWQSIQTATNATTFTSWNLLDGALRA